MRKGNFLRFMGFREQVFTVTANQAHGSGDAAADTVTLTLADFGDLVDPTNNGQQLIVTVQAAGNVADGRGTKYTKDAITGATFAGFTSNTDTHDVAAGDVTRLQSADIGLHSSNGTLTITGVSGANGYDIKQNDIVTVRAYYGSGDLDTKVVPFLSTEAGNVASTGFTESDGVLLPANNFLGADPLTSTSTRLSFKAQTGTAADDDIVLFHEADKFFDVCRMMHAAINADHLHAPIVITDVANGITAFNDQFGLGITKCQINHA